MFVRSRTLFAGISRTRSGRRPSLLVRLSMAAALRRSRRQLRNLDARMLSDIGLSRSEAEAESERPFWDPPGHWLK